MSPRQGATPTTAHLHTQCMGLTRPLYAWAHIYADVMHVASRISRRKTKLYVSHPYLNPPQLFLPWQSGVCNERAKLRLCTGRLRNRNLLMNARPYGAVHTAPKQPSYNHYSPSRIGVRAIH